VDVLALNLAQFGRAKQDGQAAYLHACYQRQELALPLAEAKLAKMVSDLGPKLEAMGEQALQSVPYNSRPYNSPQNRPCACDRRCSRERGA
jgi:hypothetical protein